MNVEILYMNLSQKVNCHKSGRQEEVNHPMFGVWHINKPAHWSRPTISRVKQFNLMVQIVDLSR